MGQITVDLSSRSELKRSLPTEQRAGIEFPRYFTAKLEAGKTPYDEVVWELRTASIGNDKGSVIFEQRDIEVPGRLVADGHQHRRQQVLPRQAGLARPRDAASRNWSTAWSIRSPTGARRAATSRPHQDARELPRRTGAPDADAEGVLQLAGLVQRGGEGRRAATAGIYDEDGGRDRNRWRPGETRPQCSACFIVSREGFARIDSGPGEDRGHAVQVGFGHGHRTSPRCAKRTRFSRAAAGPPGR